MSRSKLHEMKPIPDSNARVKIKGSMKAKLATSITISCKHLNFQETIGQGTIDLIAIVS